MGRYRIDEREGERDRERERERERASRPPVRRRLEDEEAERLEELAPPGAPTPTAMTRLQRTAGNSAVVQLLSGAVSIQRAPPTAQKDGGAATADLVRQDDATLTDQDLAFWGVLKYGTVLMINNAGLNDNARGLVTHMKEKVRPTGEKFTGHYVNLGFAATDIGPEDIDAVKAPKVQAKLEKAMTGKKGDRLRGFVKDFVNSHDDLAEKLKLHDAARDGFQATTLELKKATLEQTQTAKKREVDEAAGAVAARKEELEKQKKWLEQVIDTGISLAQGKFMDAAMDGLKFVSKEVIGALLEADPKLAAAEENLKAAKAALMKVEDETHATAIAAAAKRVQEQQKKMEAAWMAVKSAAKKSVQAQVPLTEALDSMGLSEVGTAMADRQWVMGEAEQATRVLGEYQGLVTPVGKSAEGLKRAYGALGGGMSSPGGEATIPDPGVRAELATRCAANVDTCEKIIKWQEAELKRIEETRGDIAKGEWLKPFETIDELLQGLLAGGGASAPIP